MEDFQESPAEQLIAVLMGDGEPNYIPDDIKNCFCKFNSVCKNNKKDNFFSIVVKKYLTQLCIKKDIYLEKMERFPINNLKKANLYLTTYSNGIDNFNCYFINRQGDMLLDGGGEIYSFLERCISSNGCVRCDFDKFGCEYCNTKLIEKIIKDVPDDYVNVDEATFGSLRKLFGKKEIDVIIDFMNYYMEFCRNERNEECEVNKKITERNISDNVIVEKLLSQLERLDPKIIDGIKSFIIDLFSQNGKIEEVTALFKGCKNVEETIGYLCQLLMKLRDAVVDVQHGEDERARSLMDLFLLDFFG